MTTEDIVVFIHHQGKKKLSLWLTKHYNMKAYGGVDVYNHVVFTSA
jgi:hypothetical protein